MRADALAGRHYGEMSCRDFREGLLAVLPQGWAAPRDTAFEEALFVRHKEGAGQQKAQLARLAAAKAAAAGVGCVCVCVCVLEGGGGRCGRGGMHVVAGAAGGCCW
jgi:hypothetical protein